MRYLLQGNETQRLAFRKISSNDFDEWLNFFRDPSSFEHWTSPTQKPEVVCKEWYDRQFQRYENDEGGMNALIEKATGKLIGHCGLLVQRVDDLQELEIGYSLLGYFRNKGFATEAARKCRDYAFGNNLFDSLISIISITHATSAKVAIKSGMKKEKETIYKENQVAIFRIKKVEWLEQNCE
jgi:[ribosomal protein S5]-alanine N-acetyltransferase